MEILQRFQDYAADFEMAATVAQWLARLNEADGA